MIISNLPYGISFNQADAAHGLPTQFSETLSEVHGVWLWGCGDCHFDDCLGVLGGMAFGGCLAASTSKTITSR